MTYEEAKADCFAALIPETGSQFRWLKPDGEKHMIFWGLERKTKVAMFHVSYTQTLARFELPFLWYSMARQIIVPLQWK